MTTTNIIATSSGYKVFMENFRAARALNKLVKQYKQDNGKLYVFQEGEEAIFTINPELYKKTLKIFKKYGMDP